jgi:hypothetical protein
MLGVIGCGFSGLSDVQVMGLEFITRWIKDMPSAKAAKATTSNVVGTYLISKLKEIQSEFLDWIGDVRGKG